MGALFLLLVAWCIASMIFAEIVPLALEALWYALCYLIECFGVALGYLFKGMFRAIGWLAKQSWRGVSQGTLFLAFLAQEWWRGAASEDEGGRIDEDEPAGPFAGQDPYHAALGLLGLAPGFSRPALNRAYKQAMKHAHPDAGGSSRKAQAVNAARELLMRAHGWA